MDYIDHKTLKKGDRILIEAEVAGDWHLNNALMLSVGGVLVVYSKGLNVHKVLPRPIKVGDVVWEGYDSLSMHYTVEAIASNGDWLATYKYNKGPVSSIVISVADQKEFKRVEQE